MSVTDPEWLKAELAKTGRSQSALARHMDLDSSAINRLVNGVRELKAREIEQIEGYLAETTNEVSLLPDRIKERLAATGKTARGASLEAGLSPEAVRTMLDGRSKSPRAENLAALAEVLDCDLAYLAGGETAEGSVSRRLREARERAGYKTAADAAEAHGWTYSTYAGHENGSRGLRPEQARAYAEAFGVAPEWLVFGEAEAPPPSMPPARAAPTESTLTIRPGGKVMLDLKREVSFATAAQILALIEGDAQ